MNYKENYKEAKEINFSNRRKKKNENNGANLNYDRISAINAPLTKKMLKDIMLFIKLQMILILMSLKKNMQMKIICLIWMTRFIMFLTKKYLMYLQWMKMNMRNLKMGFMIQL